MSKQIQYENGVRGRIVSSVPDEVIELLIPDEEDGTSVVEIGPAACKEKKYLERVKLGDGVSVIGNYAFAECRALKEIQIPDKVQEIGAHAFYNCRQLNVIKLPGEIREFGDGALKNCNSLHKITIHLHEKENATVKHLLKEVMQPVELSIHYTTKNETAVLYYPKDVVQISDFSTRLYMDIRYGVGNHYRQAVTIYDIDYARYDSLFTMAYASLNETECGKIAMNRLRYPYELKEEARTRYSSYVKKNLLELVKVFIREENIKEFSFLLQEEFVHKENIEQVLAIAYESESAEAVSLLIEYKQKWAGKRDLTFEL